MHRHGSAGEPHRRPRHQSQHRRASRWPTSSPTVGRRSTDVILPTESAGIDVAPAHIDLASTEGELFTALGREQILRDALEGQIDGYDYVLIDCPPNLGLLTVNGLVAANGVIIPVQTQYYAMKGLNNLVKVINTIRMKLNRDLRILGLLPTFYDGRTNLARDMLDELRVVGDHHVFNSIVRNTVKLGEAPLVGRPITSYAGSIRSRAHVSRARAGGDRPWPGLTSAPPPPAACPRSASSPPPSSACCRRSSRRGRVGVRDRPGRPDRAEPGAAAARLRRGRARTSWRPRSASTASSSRSSSGRSAPNRYQLDRRRAPLARLEAGRARRRSRRSIEEIDDDTALEISIIENLQREDLSPLDEAAMYDRMVREHGYSIRKLADKLGKDKGYLENRLRLADAPDEIRELVSLRKDTLSHAYELLKVEDPKKRRRLADQVAPRRADARSSCARRSRVAAARPADDDLDEPTSQPRRGRADAVDRPDPSTNGGSPDGHASGRGTDSPTTRWSTRKQQLTDAVEDLVGVLRAPDVMRLDRRGRPGEPGQVPDDRQARLENAIAMVRRLTDATRAR